MDAGTSSQASVRRWPAWISARPALSTESLAMLASIFFTACCNGMFWHRVVTELQVGAVFAVSLFICVTALQAFLLGLVLTRWTTKPLLTVLLACTAFAAYYMQAYNVYLDADMIRNVLHTDPAEARELFVAGMIAPLLLLAALPIALLWRVRIVARGWRRAIAVRLGFLVATLLITVAAAGLSFQDLSALLRSQREVRYLVTPVNYVSSLAKVLMASPPGRKKALIPIGLDATQSPRDATRKPRLLVFVLGETVRAQNWGLSGYARQTTPELAAMRDVVNFPNASSCGTSTEVSVPCLFSPYGRRDYNEDRIRSHQSLLHVLDRAGVQTLWRDNQSGCKGVCAGLPFESLADATVPGLCNGTRCFDEILLHDIDKSMVPAVDADGRTPDRVIVLHQLGNHGPAYFQRYPASFRRFTPTCDSDELGKCTRAEIVNAYDNAIGYTDHVLAMAIARLKQDTGHDTALIYVSDHGESLGEKGLFLHGVPYAIAPAEQTRVPMLMWLSPGFIRDERIDMPCLRREAATRVSHDNLFPSILGLMQVRSAIYRPAGDLFADCRTR